MSMHRPAWMICEGQETTIYRVTTVINKFMDIKPAHPTITFTNLYSFELQTLRYHIFNVQPGVTDTTTTGSGCTPTTPCLTDKALTGNIQTFQSTEAVVVDLRQEDETLRWPLATCGDTLVNSTYGFEDCDYAKHVDTPINLIDAGLATMNTYNYPAPTFDIFDGVATVTDN